MDEVASGDFSRAEIFGDLIDEGKLVAKNERHSENASITNLDKYVHLTCELCGIPCRGKI